MKYTFAQCRKIFNEAHNPSLRQWKIMLQAITYKRFSQNKEKISSPEKLHDFLKGNVMALYHSISYFMKPQLVRGKLTNLKEAGYLYSDFLIDLDSKGNFEEVRKDAAKAIDGMKKSEYKLVYSGFSGGSGIHLVYGLKIKPNIKNIEKRFEFYRLKTIKFQNQIAQLNLKTYDFKVTEMFRIYAVPYSHKENGNIVLPLTEGEIKSKRIYTRLASHNIVLDEPEKLLKKAIIKGDDGVFPRAKERKKDRFEVRSSFKYLDNIVRGTKNQSIIIIEKHKTDFFKMLNTIPFMQRTYQLSDFYVFESCGKVYFACFKCVSSSRLLKILKAAKSLNISELASKKHIPLPISGIKLLNVIKSGIGLKDAHSKAHCNFFGIEYEKMIGAERADVFESKTYREPS